MNVKNDLELEKEVASIVNIIILIFGYKFNLIEFIIGMILFAGGYILSAKYLKGE